MTIGASIESIENYTFSGCTKLKEVQIPNSVTSIGNKAFYSCEKLTDINYVGNETDWKEITIGTDNTPLKMPK